MGEAELAGFLHDQRTVICATIGRDGWPHLMPLWYVVRDAPDRPGRELVVIAHSAPR